MTRTRTGIVRSSSIILALTGVFVVFALSCLLAAATTVSDKPPSSSYRRADPNKPAAAEAPPSEQTDPNRAVQKSAADTHEVTVIEEGAVPVPEPVPAAAAEPQPGQTEPAAPGAEKDPAAQAAADDPNSAGSAGAAEAVSVPPAPKPLGPAKPDPAFTPPEGMTPEEYMTKEDRERYERAGDPIQTFNSVGVIMLIAALGLFGAGFGTKNNLMRAGSDPAAHRHPWADRPRLPGSPPRPLQGNQGPAGRGQGGRHLYPRLRRRVPPVFGREPRPG